MNLLRVLADPGQVAKFQRFCGVEYEKPATCDQQTQTRGESSDSESNNEQDEQTSKNVSPDHQDATSSTSASTLEKTVSNNLHESQVSHRIAPDNKFEEYNNNLNIENSKIRKRNGYHIVEPSTKAYTKKSTIFECNYNSAGEKSVNNESASKSSDIIKAASPSPTVCIKYKFLLYLAYFGAFLGNEEFYLTFFPFGVWNLDSSLIRKVAMLWCVVMYLGQATKDYLRWPRPPWPPVVRLETHYSQEFSMPSTHAMAGTAIPFCLVYYVVGRYQVNIVVAGTVALLWFSITCWSRLYLGVHTILDLLAGFVYALLILLAFFGYVEGYDLYQQTHPFAAPVLLFTALALCTICYPSNYKNSSKGDAVQIVAALTGVGIGSWLGYQLGYMHEAEILEPYSITIPTLSWCGLALLRFATGVVVLAVLYALTRWLSIRFYSYMYGLDAPDKTFPGVMIAYKFTTYTVVGSGITFFAPLVHFYLGIHRAALFYEVS